jgi:glycosyltransferase involved in cell wall biosynthesis
VVVPLRTGGGTRIKLLEAFAHGVPVVASPVAATGLDVTHCRHLLIAESPDQASAAVERIITEPDLAASLVAAAGRLIRDRYTTDVVLTQIREFFGRAADRGGAQLSALP